jgi:SOS-response transcriptional repressor LexA
VETRERVFEFILEYKATHDGLAPSYGEIMEACGIKSRGHVNHILVALDEEGLIHKGDGYRNLSVPGGRWTYDPESVVA